MMIFPPITTHVKKALYGCMHVFLYDAHTNGSKLFTIYQKLLIYTCNINLEAVQYVIERIHNKFKLFRQNLLKI